MTCKACGSHRYSAPPNSDKPPDKPLAGVVGRSYDPIGQE
jgi:hypothetical protein